VHACAQVVSALRTRTRVWNKVAPPQPHSQVSDHPTHSSGFRPGCGHGVQGSHCCALTPHLCTRREGGSLGELNHAIVVDQFSRLRQGDSWWYERPGVLDRASRAEVKGTYFVSGELV
jgi:hypothetical protein